MQGRKVYPVDFQGTHSYRVFDRTLQALQPSLHLCLTEFQVRSKQTDRKIVVETDGEALSEPWTVLPEPKPAEATPCSLTFAPLRGVEWRRLVSFATTTTTTTRPTTLNPNCLMYVVLEACWHSPCAGVDVPRLWVQRYEVVIAHQVVIGRLFH
jgi:hypothetical protein